MGLVGCVAAIACIWNINARFNRASGNVFGAIDHSLVDVRLRIAQTQDRVQVLQITTEDIEQSVTNRAKTEARERLTSRLGVEEKAERLVSGLQQADHRLELTQSSLQFVQQALEAGSSLGAPVQTDPADRLLGELASLRDQLTQAIEPVNRIRERALEVGEDGLREEGFNQVAQLAVRVNATLSSIDSRLENLAMRLTEIQTKTRNTKVQSMRWIRITAIGITLLFSWMAAGQGALCHLGWKGLRQR